MIKISASKNQTQDQKLKKPYSRCLKILENISKVKGPYQKIFSLISCIEKITSEIDSFYNANDYDTTLMITGEELFPIIIYLLLECGNKGIVLDIFICSLFMTEKMKIARSGFCVQSFMAAVDFISGNSFMDNMRRDTRQEEAKEKRRGGGFVI